MFAENALLWHSLFYGILLSLVLGGLIWGSIYVNPEIWVNDYPPDVRAKYGPIGEKAKRQRQVLAALFFPALIAVPMVSLFQLPRVTGAGIPFLPVFVSLFLIFMVFNLVDLLIFDWLVAVTLRPRFMILPGTEGMAGYRSYRFHFRGFLIGSLAMTVLSLVMAVVVMAVNWVF